LVYPARPIERTRPNAAWTCEQIGLWILSESGDVVALNERELDRLAIEMLLADADASEQAA
jgi:hypothetical protein